LALPLLNRVKSLQAAEQPRCPRRNEHKTTPANEGGLPAEAWNIEKLLEEVNRQ
jgi:hypothetical protein